MPKIFDDSSPEAINLRIKLLRQASGMTPAMLAKSAGVGQTAITNWETTRTHVAPGIRTLERIAFIFGVPLIWLWRGEGLIPKDLQEKVIALHTGEMKPPKTRRKRKPTT